MLKIAVCDDDPIMLDFVSKNANTLLAQSGAGHTTVRFLSGTEFLKAHKAAPFDVVFLDIDMPKISGFDVAEQINSINETLIIFVTSHDELVYSSIRFRPFRFIRKTYLENELSETLEAVINEITKRDSGRKFMFQTKSGEVFVDLSRVEYIEIYGHWLRVCIKDDEPLNCYGSLSDFERKLEEHDFVRTHKSFLVNCKFIFAIEKNQVVLDDKTIIPLSRYKSEMVKNKFKKLLRGTL